MATIPDELLQGLAAVVERHLGLYFPRERWRDLERGVEATCRELAETGVEACARKLLAAHPDRRLIESFGRHLTIGETYFFREPQAYRVLERHFLPELLAERRRTGKALRFWSAACASGEEAYSLAILLRRLLPDLEDWQVTILGTDINSEALRKAEQGLYGEWSFRGSQEVLRDRWFSVIGPGRYQLRPEIRRLVTFAYHNLADDPYPALDNNTNAMDVIFCRNVLMYFAAPMRQRVLSGLQRCLMDGGILVTGAAESHLQPPDGLNRWKLPEVSIFRKELRPEVRPWPAPPVPIPSPGKAPPPALPPAARREQPPAPGHRGAEVLLDAYRRGEYVAICRQASGLRPTDSDFAPAALITARACANIGSLEEALLWVETVIARRRLDPEAHYLRALILDELGRTPEGLDALRTTLYIDPGFLPACVALGNVFHREGDRRQAERNYRNALVLLEPYADDDPVPHAEGMRAGRLREAVITAMGGGHGAQGA